MSPSRLVLVRSSVDSSVTIQTSEFDATGRRIKKVVTNSGDLDATTVYLYDGHKIAETRNGSGTMVSQFIHGTQHIDELVMERVADKGEFYVHQDANWNVIATTDLGRGILERYTYTAYGELTVDQETSFGDSDGDQDVDATDKGTVGTTCTGTVSGECRILDLDFDGDYDATDATKFDALAQGIARHPGRTWTGVFQPFAHQGLLYDTEIALVHNRKRSLSLHQQRFNSPDPLGYLLGRPIPQEQYVDGLNRYTYVKANPLRFRDPMGLEATDPCLDACTAAHNAGYAVCSSISKWWWNCGKRARCFTCLNGATTACTACCTGGYEWPPGSGIIVGPDDPVGCSAVHAGKFAGGKC